MKLDGPSVLEIEVHDNTGAESGQASGVVIAPGGIVATNAHVVTGACNLYVKETSGSLIAASTLLNIDAKKDIAILLFPKTSPVAKLGDSRALQAGDRVVAIGNPLGLEQTVSEGIVSGLRIMDGQRSVVQITAPISPGSSGGGLFNSKGDIIGLTTFTLQNSQNLNFAVPLADVMALLKNGDQELNPDNFTRWEKFKQSNCSGSTPSLDAMVIEQQILGREISDPQVMEALKKLNKEKDAIPARIYASQGKEERYYSFPTYVSIHVLDGLCDRVIFYAPEFRGILPLGLSWDKSRAEVQQLIGQPSHTSASPDGREVIDNYTNFRQYGYDISYVAGKLDYISAH